VRGEAKHDDVVVEVDRSEVEFFADLTNFARGEAKSFLEAAFAIVFSKGILVSMGIVLDSDTSEMAFLEDAIFNAILRVETSDSFKQISQMFSYALHFVFLQDEPILPPFVKAFLIAKKSVLSHVAYNWQIAGYFFFAFDGSGCFFHEGNQKFLKGVHVFGEVLGQGIVDFPVSDGRLADDFFEF
jgi:hypothetical protein